MPEKIARKWGRRYPWKEWFALGNFILERGKDFNGRTDTMMTQVRQQASKMGRSVSITASDDGTFINVTVWDGTSNHD